MLEKLYLLTLLDLETWKRQQIWVRTTCPHDWQEWVNEWEFDPPLTIRNPLVVGVQAHMCQLTPVVDPVH